MCGRYVSPTAAEAERYFTVHLVQWEFGRNFNVAPTQQVPVVRLVDGERQGLMMRWGLVPFFARGVPPKYSTINATIERLADGACWKGPWTRGQRCILPATGFYEWHLDKDDSKTPFYITAADQPLFGLAGIWDRSKTEDGSVMTSCAVITMPASPFMAEIHNAKQRMPAMLAAEDIEAWLTGTQDQARAALRQYPDDLLHAHKIAKRVNTPANNDVDLLTPLA
jgi:putative SOS response-associated peptidase YedK